MPRDESAAVTAAAAMLAADQVELEATEAPEGASDEATEQESEEENEQVYPNFEIELPDDLLTELETEDLEELDEPEETEEYEELDEDGKRLLARARAAERKAEHYEELRVKEARKNWVGEANKFFPLSSPFLEEITATSRKGFLREAKARHEAVLPLVKPFTEQIATERAKIKEEALAEAKAEAEKRWGKPAGESAPPAEAAITQEQLARNRAKGDLTSTIRSMIFPGGS